MQYTDPTMYWLHIALVALQIIGAALTVYIIVRGSREGE